jgi:lipopolysaccharide transport system permease protein
MNFTGPEAGAGLVDLRELWRFRELALVFAQRDLKVRYRQAAIGIAWAILQPLLTMLVSLVLFGWLGRQPVTAGAPYAVMVYIGLLVWQLFAYTVRESTASLVGHRDLVTKVYFPRLLLPLSTLLCALVDFAVALVVLAPLMLWAGVTPGLAVVWFPCFLLLAMAASMAVGIWLAALNALYRDIGYVVPFLLQLGLFVSPVLYETTALVPAEWRFVWQLNPLVAAIEGCRWACLPSGTGTPPGPLMIVQSVVVTSALLAGGLWYFRRAEQWIADRI